MGIIAWQWILVIASSLALFFIAPWSKNNASFFKASKENKKPGRYTLAASLLISWIFAKSISNAADLGNSYGFIGGVAYALYYASFLVCGWIIIQLRKSGFKSIHQFLQSKFGKGAVLLFSLLVAFRLFNEVWSNTMVIGSYFGPSGSSPYYASIILFTCLTLAYTLKGGLNSSLLTDVIQLGLFAVLLCSILFIILPKSNYDIGSYIQEGNWTMSNGLNLIFVVLIQIWSYPFHDPVMTDRGFISSKKNTLQAYVIAAVLGFICIVLFSFVGIFARKNGLENPATVNTAKLLGTGLMLIMNVIMVTSAASTLDSTFSSFSKLSVIDLGFLPKSVKSGRIAMLILTVVGTLPILFSPTILSATTISGTMVIGLAPIFIFHKVRVPKISYFLSVAVGLAFGIALAIGAFPDTFIGITGPYTDLLLCNIFGSIACLMAYFSPLLFKKSSANA